MVYILEINLHGGFLRCWIYQILMKKFDGDENEFSIALIPSYFKAVTLGYIMF